MSTAYKKRILVILLSASCILCGGLLLSSDTSTTKTLQSFSYADSLLQRTFKQFNINDDQITQVHHEVDSGFVRKEYIVEVSPTFSKTQFHADLNRTLYPYDVKTPARIDLDNQFMSIYVYYRDAVIRNIHLRMDPSLVQDQQPASMMVVFENPPSAATLRQLASFGEPVPMVFRVQQALQAKQLQTRYSDRYSHLAFWFIRRDGSSLLNDSARPTDLQTLKRFAKLSPQTHVLSFLPDAAKERKIAPTLNNLSLQFIPAFNALRISQKSSSSFTDLLERFERQAAGGEHPVLLLRNGENMLQRLHRAILQFKKRGLEIVPPPVRSY